MTTDPSHTPVEDSAPLPHATDAASDATTPISAEVTDSPPAVPTDAESPHRGEEPPIEQGEASSPSTETGEATAANASEPSKAPSAEASSALEPKRTTDESAPRQSKIRVGSRRADAAEKVTSAKPLLAGEAHQPVKLPALEKAPGKKAAVPETTKPAASPKKVAVPSRRDPLPAELEEEIASALGDQALDQLVSSGPTEDVGDTLDMDSRHRANVVKIHGDNVFFSLGGRNQGVASLRQFKEPPLVGSQAEVVITGISTEDGLYELTVPGASVQVHDWSDLVEGTVVEARVTGSNTGGLECTVGNIRGFVPASQIEMFHVDNYADYYDKKLACVVTEANRRRRNLVLSHRAVVEREKEEQRKKLLEELEIGQVLEGVVSSIREFGAFVDIGGLDGLVHVSRLSWERVEDPGEVLQVGQKVRVKVEKVDPQTGKISLTYRDLLEHPWTDAEQRFPGNSIVKGTVTRTAKFGAFVKVAPGIEGLVHVSELAHHRVVQVTSVVKEGDEIEVKVLSVDPDAQRMSLSLKQAHALPEPEEKPTGEEQADEPPPEPTVPERNEPLKGGTDRSSGGEEFGLKW